MVDTNEVIPEAKAVLARNQTVWQWIIRVCEWCGQEHWHGGGSIRGDPRQLLGSRSAHCPTDPKDRYKAARGHVWKTPPQPETPLS
jgi:hypothetical protein